MAPAAFNTTEDSTHETKHYMSEQREEKSMALDGLLEGLQRSPKTVPCSYLYDAAGSELYNMVHLQTSIAYCCQESHSSRCSLCNGSGAESVTLNLY